MADILLHAARMRPIYSFVAVAVSLVGASLVFSGCPDRSIAKVVPVQSGAITKTIPVEADIDILFVIDNSASTQDKQTVFAQNFPKFVQALDMFPSGRPNIHIAVASSSVSIGNNNFGANCAKGDDGAFQSKTCGSRGLTAPEGCDTTCQPPNGAFLSDIKLPDGTRQTNYSGTLDQALSCIAELGTTGCGFEAQLEGMKRALDGSSPGNAGFLRDGAYLAVIFLTDEDDCSVKDPSLFTVDLGSQAANQSDFRCQPYFAYTCDQPISASGPGTYTNCKTRTGSYLQDPSYYYDFLTTLKPASQVVVAMIAGDPTSTMTMTGSITSPINQTLALEPSCTATINGNMAIGRPAIRLNDFVTQFGDHGLFATVCQSDYSNVMSQIGTLLFNAISPCLEGAIDTTDADPSNPGLQPQCTVSDVQQGGSNGHEEQIPVCPMTDPNTPAANGPRPCWWVKSNPAACATTTGLELHVERTTPPAIGTSVQVSCAVSQM